MCECFCKCCVIPMLVIAVICAIGAGLFYIIFPYPSHASCKVNWEYGQSCGIVQAEVTQQIIEWSDTACTTNQRCGYELVGTEGNVVKGTRTTAGAQYVDSFSFTFTTGSNGCDVFGVSSSDTWYALIDFGYNYCNLKNLILGIGEDGNKPYHENSTNAVCTMYSIAYCYQFPWLG